MAQVNGDAEKKKIDWDHVWAVMKYAYRWMYRLRSIILAIPVAITAIVLAIYNSSKLPEIVGMNMQANGEYASAISRGVAVMGPLAVTAVCLLLMFCSKRVFYPWLISVFSLILPFVFQIMCSFP